MLFLKIRKQKTNFLDDSNIASRNYTVVSPLFSRLFIVIFLFMSGSSFADNTVYYSPGASIGPYQGGNSSNSCKIPPVFGSSPYEVAIRTNAINNSLTGSTCGGVCRNPSIVLSANENSFTTKSSCTGGIYTTSIIKKPNPKQPLSCHDTEGNPVNVATGAKIQEEDDIVNTKAYGISFSRTYNSYMYNDTPLNMGKNWRHNYQRRVYSAIDPLDQSPTKQQTVQVWRANGQIITFIKINNGWKPDADIYNKLERLLDSNGAKIGWKYTTTSNTEELYDEKGFLQSIKNIFGNATTLQYDFNDNLVNVLGSTGESLTFTYDLSSRIKTVTGQANRIWKYQYDILGNLIAVLEPDSTPGDDADNKRRIYHYEDAGFPNALTGITDERGIRYAHWEYDAQGNAKSSYHGPKTNILANRIDGVSIVYAQNGTRTVTDSKGGVSNYTTSTQLGVALVSDVKDTACSNCGADKSYNYDPINSNLLSKTQDNITTTYSNYDPNGNPGTITEAFGTPRARQTDYTYDPRYFKKILTKTEPSVFATGNKTTTYTYDNFGNTTRITIDGFTPGGFAVSRTTRLQYNGPLNQLTQIDGPRTDASDITTLTYYANEAAQGNNRARLKTIISSGITLRDNIQYTPTRKVQTETRPNGLQITNTYYPGNDRLETATETAGGISRVTKWAYLATGEVNSITTADGTTDATTITLSYDDARRLTTITDGIGNYIQYTLDTEGNQTNEEIYDAGNVLNKALTQTFDTYNRLASTATANETQTYNFLPDGTLDTQTDGNNKITQYTYDELKRLSTTTQDKNGTNPDTADVLTQYGYDIADRLTNVIDPVNGNTTYVYDDLGNRLSETSPDTGNKTYTHDEAGNTATLTDAKSQVFNYTYDPLNRLTNIDAPGTDDDTTYTYDTCQNGTGKLCSITNPQATINYSYNGFGDTTDHQGINYTYDNAGRTKTIIYPSGAIVTYNYDRAGQITQVNLDQNGQQTTLADNITYTPFGPIKTLTYGNGKTLNQRVDQAYRLSQQNTTGVLALDYTQYDANGNLQTRTNTQTNITNNYTYDAINRLDSATGQFGNNGYAYDRNGNRTTTSTTDSLTYTANSNRLTTLNNTPVTQDANGNTTQIRALTLAYNSFNRLIDINNETTYQYNGAGQRNSKTAPQPAPNQPGQTGDANNDGRLNTADRQSILNQILNINTAPGNADCNQDNTINVLDLVCLNNRLNTQASNTTLTTTNYTYSLSGQLLSESTNTPISEYIYLNGQPLALINSNQVYYVHNDHLGTPQKLSNASGAVVWSAIYDPFGNTTVNEDVDNDGINVVFNLRFRGQYYDVETGLHYNYYRYYDPATGRYITSDPIGLVGGLNTYTYVDGNPVNYFDPYGLWKFKWKGYSYDTATKITQYTKVPLTLTRYKSGKYELTGDISIEGGSCTVSSDGTVDCIIEAGPVLCEVKADKNKNVLDVNVSLSLKGLFKSGKIAYDVVQEVAIQGATTLKEAAENSEAFNPKLRLEWQMREQGL